MQTLFPAIHGYRVNPGIELSKGWTPDELKNVMYGLASDPADRALLLESCSGSEADALLNPGTMILEAVTAQYNRLPRTMAALSRVLGRYLGNGLTIEGEPFIGPDRKNALFAYKVVTFNISDGQTVSVLFHSPDSDPKRFQPEETLIAYRWMLNKRDITASVAPERGRDITLELMARRMAQLIESNSAKFQEQAAARDARIAELEQATARRDELSAMSAQLADEIVSFEDELQAIQARASRTADRLSAERARAERLRGAGVGAGVGDAEVNPLRDIPFMISEDGMMQVYSPDGTEKYPSDWTGITITGSKDFWYIGYENGERTLNKLNATTFAQAQAEVAARNLDATTNPDTQSGDAGTTQPEPTQAEGPFMHAGYRISPFGNGRWYVQSHDNKIREQNGERQIGGDQIFDTVEAAKKQAEFQSRQADADAAQRAEDDAKRAAEADAEAARLAEYSDIGGPADETPVQRGRRIAALSTMIRESSTGEVLTTKQFIEKRIDAGWLPEAHQENKVKDVSRTRFNRMNQREQDEHARKIKEGGKVDVYYLTNDGYLTQITKIGYDYALHYIAKKESAAATTNPDKPSSTEAFATTPYADPRTRYAAALAEELVTAGFTTYDFPVNQSDFELGQYTAVAGMEMVAGHASVYVDSVEAGQAKVTARFSPELQPGMPVLYNPSQEFTFPVPVGVLEGKFDDVVGEISGWLAQFGTAFDNVKLPEFGSKLKTEGVNEHDAADIAKRIRQDIKEVLPPGFKPSFISVKTSKYSMGQSIGITIKKLPDGFPMYETKAIEDQYGRKSYPLTRDAAALLKTLKAIGNAYRFDNSEPETDYFHTNFYFNVSFDSALENEQRALAENGGIVAAYHRVLINSPFGNFHVFVEHSNEATTDDYKKDTKEAFISDSGIGNGVASVSQVKVVGEPEPVTSLPADATRAKNAAWAYISKVASESQGSQGEKASAAVSNGRPNATGTVGDEAAKGWRKAAYKRLEGSYLIDSPASDDNGVIEGVRRITVLTGNNIAHFHYAESNNAENSAAKAAAEAWAKGGNAQSDAVDQVEPQPSTPGNDPQPQEQTVNETEAIGQELQKLANGEVTDTGLFDQMLDDLADRAEKAGAMDELDALLNAAADKLTELLEKEAANVA